MRKKISLLFALILIMQLYTGSAGAFSYIGFQSAGDFLPPVSAGTAGSGGAVAGTENGGMEIIINPALAASCGSLSVNYEFNASMIKELRIDALKKVSSVSNSTVYRPGRFSAVYPYKGKWTLAAGFAVSPVYDLNYYFVKNTVATSFFLTNREEISQTGQLGSYSPVLAVSAGRFGNLGLAFNIIRGSKEMERSTTQYNNNGTMNKTVTSSSAAAFSGSSFSIGYAASPAGNLKVSLAYSGGISGNWDSVPTEYPALIRGGLSYFSQNTSSSISMDLERIFWSGYSYDSLNPSLSDIWNLYAGIETEVAKDWKLRYGMKYLPFNDNASGIAAIAFTFGTGFPVWILDMDIALEYSKIAYSGQSVVVPGDLDRIDASYLDMRFGLSFAY